MTTKKTKDVRLVTGGATDRGVPKKPSTAALEYCRDDDPWWRDLLTPEVRARLEAREK